MFPTFVQGGLCLVEPPTNKMCCFWYRTDGIFHWFWRGFTLTLKEYPGAFPPAVGEHLCELFWYYIGTSRKISTHSNIIAVRTIPIVRGRIVVGYSRMDMPPKRCALDRCTMPCVRQFVPLEASDDYKYTEAKVLGLP